MHHPIGQAKWLETPLHAKTDAYMQELANKAITEAGSDLTKAMEDAAEDLASEAADLCPKDLTILSRSDHVTVTSDGEVVFDRPPESGRLSEEESEQIHDHDAGREKHGKRGHRGDRPANIRRQTDEDRTRGRGKGRRINPG